MKRILFLGGSAQQVIAITTAKKMGYHTIVCDYLPDNPGQFEADTYYNASTTDIDAVYRIAKEENVDGILAYASDPAALPAAIVSERLGLPTNPAKSVEILGLKYRWREFLKENGFATPEAFSFTVNTDIGKITENIKDFDFPLVVKPTDSSGSKGVTIINDLEELKKAILCADAYSRNKILIVEEYIQRGFPHVIGGDIFVCDGKIVLFGEMECLRDLENAPLIPIGEKNPSSLSEKQREQIFIELQKAITALGIKFGEMNIEVIIDIKDNIHLLELGPRAGGNMIPIQLGDTFGIDLVKANIQVSLGEMPDFIKEETKKRPGCYMHYVLHSYKEGVLDHISIDRSIEKNVYRKVMYKKTGDNVERFDGAGKALGIIFLHFDTIQDMDSFCEKHDSLIKTILQ